MDLSIVFCLPRIFPLFAGGEIPLGLPRLQMPPGSQQPQGKHMKAVLSSIFQYFPVFPVFSSIFGDVFLGRNVTG